jgi:hypothetical protein
LIQTSTDPHSAVLSDLSASVRINCGDNYVNSPSGAVQADLALGDPRSWAADETRVEEATLYYSTILSNTYCQPTSTITATITATYATGGASATTPGVSASYARTFLVSIAFGSTPGTDEVGGSCAALQASIEATISTTAADFSFSNECNCLG